MYEQPEFKKLVAEVLKNQESINESINKTITNHGKSIKWLMFSNIALIIALTVLVLN